MRLLFGIGFILAGLAFLFYPQWEKKVYEQKQQQLIDAFELLASENEYLATEKAAQTHTAQTAVPTAMLEGAIGVIRIPKIDLEMMIFAGANEAVLSKGAGMIEPEKEFGKNNVGLAGHRGATRGKQFNRLDELVPNDAIEIQTKTANYEFIVMDTFVVDRNQVEVLADQREPLLTLVTCTPVGAKNPTKRLIVQARLSSKS
ncbi:class D sortase [Brevibacillus gelatini]|uniref:Class D sortase n=1 Tax=Brevibacillus gelatini TaxID=1655277 RepID=A0A3M8B174_9BACL|nr:class D sortase [Brevibacillus gelatini]RNB57169.1 class D sortase [Brevibacillus gelatini]